LLVCGPGQRGEFLEVKRIKKIGEENRHFENYSDKSTPWPEYIAMVDPPT